MPIQTPAAVGGSPQAPFGTANATGPTPNRGYEAAGLQRLASIVKQLEEIIPLVGAASDIGKACLESLNKLVKHVPAGSNTPASERANIEQRAMKNVQDNQQLMALRQQQMAHMQGQQGAQAA